MHASLDKSLAAAPVVLDVRVVNGSGGGPDKTILNSPRFMNASGYRMLCGYMHPPGDRGFERLRDNARLWEAPLISIFDRGPWDWQVIGSLLQICRRERVKIWHGHDYKSNLLGLILRRFWSMRLVTTVHGWVTHTRRTPLYYTIDRLCLPHYERVLCVSQDLRERCLARGVAAQRCVLLENAIDTRHYKRARSAAEAKAQLGFEPNRFLIGAIGRLAPEKGFDVLIRAVGRLVKDGHDVALVIAGEGNQKSELAALIAGLGMQDRIRLLGYRPDTVKLLEAMDLFALSSIREGLPNALLEAMALRVPVVATRVAGIPTVIHNEENGLLVEPGDVESLALALLRLQREAKLRDRFAKAGRRTVEQRYDFAVRMQKLGHLYDSLLNEEMHDCSNVT